MSGSNTLTEAIPFDQTRSVALEVFFNIMNSWNVSSLEQTSLLGLNCKKELIELKKPTVTPLDTETLRRISYILGIHKGLNELLPTREQSNKWIQKRNEAFNGHSAIEYMSQGDECHLQKVREYIDGQKNIW